MRSLRLLFAACVGCGVVLAADPSNPTRTPDELVRDLSDPNFRTREAATRDLWKLGEKVRPALEQMVKHGSPEAASRAEGSLGLTGQTFRPAPPVGSCSPRSAKCCRTAA